MVYLVVEWGELGADFSFSGLSQAWILTVSFRADYLTFKLNAMNDIWNHVMYMSLVLQFNE